MANKKKDWKGDAISAIKKVYPNASERTITNLLANMAHETSNGANSTEIPSKWKQIGDPKNNWPTIREKVNSYMQKNNLSKDEYDNLSAYKRISIQYSGDVNEGLSGGVGALQTTDVDGDKIKDMRAVGRELGLKSDKAILKYVNSNMYNSAMFSLNVLKKQGHTSEELNSHKSALDLRKKLINPGETNVERLDSVSKYEKQISQNFSNIKPTLPTDEKTFEKISDSEALRKYRETSISLSEENYKLRQDPNYIDTYNENITKIKQDYQLEVGDENIKKGNELFNEQNTKTFKSTNPYFKQISKLDKENDNLIRKRNDGKNLSPEENKRLDFIANKRNALFANIRLESNKDKLKNLQKIKDNSSLDSKEYKNAQKSYTELQNANKEIQSGFKTKKIGRKAFSEPIKETDNGFEFTERTIEGRDESSKRLGASYDNYINKNQYEGDINTNVDDLFNTEQYDFESIDEYNNEYDDDDNDDGSGGNDETNIPEEKSKRFDFLSDFNAEDFESDDPYNFTDDKEEEQSVKGFLKNNPMSALSAALGIKGIADSQSDIPSMEVKEGTALSESFYEHLNNLETISKKGFTPEEEAAYMKQINDGYMASVDLAVQASGGNRADVLSQAGELNANKNDSLLNLASKDAQLQRQNLDKYGKALQYKEAFTERKDIRRQTNEYNEKAADFEQSIQKRQGGAALAAGSINSFVNSIRDYKETGPGSVFNKSLNYMKNKLESEGTGFNTETGENYKNKEEYLESKSKRINLGNDLKTFGLSFQEKMKNNKSNSSEDIDKILSKIKTTSGEDRKRIYQEFDPSTGYKGLEKVMGSTLKGESLRSLDYLESNQSTTKQDNAYQDPYQGLYS
jgi:hypothetical protein